MAGVNIPLVSVQHQYLITEPIDGVTRDLPTLRDPDRLTYWKEEVGGLVMGGYEPNPKPWAEDGLPDGFEFQLLDDDWDHFEPLMELAVGRVPALQTAGIKEFINGPESFTPDGNFILGEAPEVRGFFVGAGFNAFGIASGGGAGMALAEWVAKGEPPYDLWPVDIRRFGRNHLDTDWVRTRTLEAYAKHYTMAWPFEEYRSGRPLRRSPLYDRLKAQGAVLRREARLGAAELVRRSARGEKAEDVYSYDRQNWFEAVGREHRACRERVALFDQTSFAKFMLAGRDAEAALSWICANDVAKPPGSLDLHADAERARRHRVRPDRRAGSPPTASTSSPAPASPRTTSTGSRATSPTGSTRSLIDVTSSERRAVADGAAVARRPRGADRATTCRTPRFPFGSVRRITRRRRAGPGAPRHLCRRARLGAAHAGRVRR